MEPKRTKYDTNPLDGKVADRADKSFGSRPGAPTEEVVGGPTRDIGRTENEAARANPGSEAPTRLIDGGAVTSYPSVFIPPKPRATTDYRPPPVPNMNTYQPPLGTPASVYQPPPVPVTFSHKSHTVQGLGISEKWASLLPYIPGHIGAVAAVIELLLVPRTETRTRFHAAQGLALQIALLILAGVFSFVTLITGSSLGSGLLRSVATIFLIISMIRAYKGKSLHITALDEPAKWLDEKIKPRK